MCIFPLYVCSSYVYLSRLYIPIYVYRFVYFLRLFSLYICLLCVNLFYIFIPLYSCPSHVYISLYVPSIYMSPMYICPSYVCLSICFLCIFPSYIPSVCLLHAYVLNVYISPVCIYLHVYVPPRLDGRAEGREGLVQ